MAMINSTTNRHYKPNHHHLLLTCKHRRHRLVRLGLQEADVPGRVGPKALDSLSIPLQRQAIREVAGIIPGSFVGFFLGAFETHLQVAGLFRVRGVRRRKGEQRKAKRNEMERNGAKQSKGKERKGKQSKGKQRKQTTIHCNVDLAREVYFS